MTFIKKGTKLYSIAKFKCPRCQEGNMFTNQNPYSFRDFFSMPKYCERCNLNFIPEPGFYYGAMYVSYGLSIIITILTYLIMAFFDFNFWTIIWVVIPILIISIPYLFKVSRVIWINMFVAFNNNKKEKAS